VLVVEHDRRVEAPEAHEAWCAPTRGASADTSVSFYRRGAPQAP
jgi:hypothetical protein